eukprot:gene9360-17064_t
MLLQRAKPAVGQGSAAPAKEGKKKKKLPKLNDFLENRDFTGAATLLEFNRNAGKISDSTDEWIAYCSFHLGDYKKALEEYKNIVKTNSSPDIMCNIACCCFMLGLYEEALEYAEKGGKSKLQNRLLFHLSHKFSDEKKLMSYHSQLQDVIEDQPGVELAAVSQLSLASIHYLRSHFQEAIDIYKRILLDNRDYLALNVYVALCYYKLDYFDVSQEVLSVYLQHFPDSAVAVNLKACNHFKLYNGKAAEAELKALQEVASPSFSFAKDLIKHNMVVFRAGEGALQVLPPLVDALPEARLNLVSMSCYYHCTCIMSAKSLECPVAPTLEVAMLAVAVSFPVVTDPNQLDSTEGSANYKMTIDWGIIFHDVTEAYSLIKDLEPTTPSEYILKGTVNATMGQEQRSREHVKIAQQYFQLVGGSASECALSLSLSLTEEFNTVMPWELLYADDLMIIAEKEEELNLKLINWKTKMEANNLEVNMGKKKVMSYFYNDDHFNFNYAQAKAAVGNYKEAEEVFLLIQSDKIKNDYSYIAWLCRCYIMNRKARLAWEMYLKMETSSESFSLLQLIANDCYKMGQFYYAAKAFDVLERLDPNPEYWEGKRGACVGIFQMIIAGHEPRETLRDVIQLLRNTANPQVEYITRTMKKWAKDNRIPIS